MARSRRRYRPLRGVRVLSFEAAFSLPAATRVLAELGAEVVRVGRPFGDFPAFTHRTDGSAINKRSLSIDLGTMAGRALALRLAAVADVVCNNFRPKFMRGVGLTYEDLRAQRSDIIVVQLTGYGSPGPWENIGAFGPSVEAAGGMDATIGLPEDPPTKVGSTVFADQTAGRYAALAIMAALERRRQTGEGCYIDLSMCESITHILGDLVLGAARAGRPPPKRGNRSPIFVPQGVYPCLGEDEWVAVSVGTDVQWQALCSLIIDEKAKGAATLRRLIAAGRLERAERHDEIDAAIASWTATVTKEEAAERLQARGIPAGPVNKVADMPFDPQLVHRGAFQWVDHEPPVLGYRSHPHLTLAWLSRGFARPPLKDARPDGADNEFVLKAWLGLSKAEVGVLMRQGAVLPPNLPPVEIGQRPRPVVDLDFAERLGLEPAQEPLA